MLAFPAASLRASVGRSVWAALGLAPRSPLPRGCSLHPAAQGQLGSPNPQIPPNRRPPCPASLRSPGWQKGPKLPLPAPADLTPLPGAEVRGAAGHRSRESGPLLPGDREGGGAGGPRRPPAFAAQTGPAAPPDPARHRAAAPAIPHSPAAGARPAGSRS